ncbi:hypothetical protein ACJMK2_009991 [Sinanodonta woodiana]|uniref:C2H2-type domain-containing protein n=1 Tax=Sinanodonta woodiana TaxID=1069815 RepID=A0ABD3VE13_SINWO
MVKKKSVLPLNTCDLCSFSTRNAYIFKRHRVRCKREKEQGIIGKVKIQKAALISHESFTEEDSFLQSDANDEGIQDSTLHEMSVDEDASNSFESGPSSAKEREGTFKQDEPKPTTPTTGGKARGPVRRNYQCERCEYTTNKSREFLYHQVEVHSANYSIHSCQHCEYCSRYKHKLLRHMKLAHRLAEGFDKVETELHSTKNSPKKVKNIFKRKKMISKSVPGKKLTIKFVRQSPKKNGNSSANSRTYKSNSFAALVIEETGEDGKNAFRCKECSFFSDEKQKVIRHGLSWHVDTKTFTCSSCNFTTMNRSEFTAHRLTHRSEHHYKCKECNYSTNFKPNFDRHMNNHVNNYPFKCKYCTYSATIEGPIKRHMATGHDFPPVEAPANIDDGNDKDSSEPGTEMEQGSEMSEDSLMGFTDDSLLDGSPAKKHLQKLIRQPNGQMLCLICGLKYKRSSDLNRHMKRKHYIKLRHYLDKIVSGEITPTMGNVEFDLEEEGKDFENNEEESMEMEEAPLDLSIKSNKMQKASVKGKVKCAHCNYIAKWPSDYRRHLHAHSLEKRYKCPDCPKKYKYIGDLNVHVRREHKKEPKNIKILKVSTIAVKKSSPAIFKCPGCPYTSCWKSEVDRHSRTHTEEKPYHCKHCEYQTYWKGDIRRHMYKHHPEVMSSGLALDDVIIVRPDKIPNISEQYSEMYSESEQDDTKSTDDSVDMKSAVADVNSFSSESSINSIEMSPSLTPVKQTSSLVEQTFSPSKDPNAVAWYKCEYCDFQANAPSKMNAHIATHVNLKPYMCPVCGRRANWKWDISKHIKKDHPNTTGQVLTLSKQEAQATIKEYMETNPVVRRDHHLNVTLEKPLRGCELFKCSACDFSSEKRISVSRHIRYMHSNETANIVILKDRSRSRSLEPAPEAQNHDSLDKGPVKEEPVSQSTNISIVSTEKEKPGDGEKPYMCAECGKRSVGKGDIKKHYHYRHPAQEIRIIYLGDRSQNPVASSESRVTVGPSLAIASPVLSTPPAPPPADIQDTKEQIVTIADAKIPDNESMSKLKNPRKVGYIRPFQCSVCGHRSNWKWDMNKHIRDKHRRSKGYVIVLSEDEARATVRDYMAKAFSKSAKEESKKDATNTSDKKESYANSKGVFKQFKCSVCPYRSNYRSDLGRHIIRKHGMSRGRIIVLDRKTAQETLADYHYDRFKHRNPSDASKLQALSETNDSLAARTEEQNVSSVTKLWKCCICSFINEDKFTVLNHLSTHKLKAYRCTACNFTSELKNHVHRHINHKHNFDHSLCKLSIKVVREGPGATQETEVEQSSNLEVTYYCALCEFHSSWRSCVCRHLRTKHDTKNYTQIRKTKYRSDNDSNAPKDAGKDNVFTSPLSIWKEGSEVTSESQSLALLDKRRHHCKICPYRTTKSKMLKFHMSCHKPQQGVKQSKCKYCPYYVCAVRLMKQHIRLHLQEIKVKNQSTSADIEMLSENISPTKPKEFNKRHQCEKCPYTTNSKNDYLYHKQFHRPKPTADFKCDHCDYWVTHKRLLRQHLKVHGISTLNDSLSEGSVYSSPAKSDLSETSSLTSDTVQIAEIKQRIIASKIISSISQSPVVSPMKLASRCSIGNKPGFVLKDGVYRRIHKCRFCPYMNIRSRNLRLHELMHKPRHSQNPLMRCPHCSYSVGSKGLLAHHLKVHQSNYTLEGLGGGGVGGHTEPDVEEDQDEKASDIVEIPYENKVDTLLEIARFKKYSCEKCPYASAKRAHFERHVELHGSRQRCTCDFCDYSVPSQNLLVQHRKLHFMPNQNLLAAQSIMNLQHLPEVPADVALSSMLPMDDSTEPVSVTHDHFDLYENTENENEPKKLYRCDRCPYANVRRDHLLAHLKCHMIKSDISCPYCDYSVAKVHVLIQHIRVHFSPLPELSDWLAQNGQIDRVKQSKETDIREAIEIAQLIQNEKKAIEKVDKNKDLPNDTSFVKDECSKAKEENGDKDKTQNGHGLEIISTVIKISENDHEDGRDGDKYVKNEDEKTKPVISIKDKETGTNADSPVTQGTVDAYICQYCDREFSASEQLVHHEMQHLIGNNFEIVLKAANRKRVNRKVTFKYFESRAVSSDTWFQRS